MILVQGAVSGRLSRVAFEPSRPRFTNAAGDTILGDTVYAKIEYGPGGVSIIKAVLPDNTELICHKRWVWLCFEYSGTKKTLFTLSSDPGTHRYADLRPVGGAQ